MRPRHRAVLVGCGPRGWAHAQGLLANPGRFELVAICDRDEARARALGNRLGIARRYADAERMLEAERPAVLCFATPPAVRLELVELGIRHGVRAIAFEKPLALSLAEARRIVEHCAAAGVKGVVCHQLKHGAHWRRLQALVAAGDIGEIRLIHATGRPSMLRVGTHLVDAMLWLAGGARATSALGRARGREAYREDHPCPDHVAGIIRFESGAEGVLEVGTGAPRHLAEDRFWEDVAVTVHGTDGYARVVLGDGWQVVTRRSGTHRASGPADRSPQEGRHLRLLADWLDDPARVHPSGLAVGYHGFEILMALVLSSLESREVKLPIDDPPEAILEALRERLGDPPGGS